jgi:3-methyladenine DNA glycosylase/8-oxoguanine DNA glycosylase
MRTPLALTPKAPFDFANTAYSHGWVVLAPNAWDTEKHVVTRVERLSSGKVVTLTVGSDGTVRKPSIRVSVESPVRLGKKDTAEIARKVGHMFRLDEDLSPFYRACRQRGGQWVKVTRGMGRLLRSPSMWEDVVKVICTTNIQWGGTKKMAAGLVEVYGEQGAFPVPGAIAAVSRKQFEASVRMGYRAPYVHELARLVVDGQLDLESLSRSELPTLELKKELLAVKGVGPYAAATLLMLIGRYDELAVDSVTRDFTAKKYFEGEKPTDTQVQALYEDWGEWKFLAYWFDLYQGLGEEL